MVYSLALNPASVSAACLSLWSLPEARREGRRLTPIQARSAADSDSFHCVLDSRRKRQHCPSGSKRALHCDLPACTTWPLGTIPSSRSDQARGSSNKNNKIRMASTPQASAGQSEQKSAYESKPTLQEFLEKEVYGLEGGKELAAVFLAVQDACKEIAERLSHLGIDDGPASSGQGESGASASGRDVAKPMDIVAVSC